MQTPNDKLRLWYHMLRGYRFAQSELREKLREKFDMTLPQFQVLAQLANEPEGQSMGDISRALLLSNANVSAIVGRMEKAGWIEREVAQKDGRAFVVRLSKRGWGIFEEIMADYRNWVDEVFAPINDNEAKLMIDALRRMRREKHDSK